MADRETQEQLFPELVAFSKEKSAETPAPNAKNQEESTTHETAPQNPPAQETKKEEIDLKPQAETQKEVSQETKGKPEGTQEDDGLIDYAIPEEENTADPTQGPDEWTSALESLRGKYQSPAELLQALERPKAQESEVPQISPFMGTQSEAQAQVSAKLASIRDLELQVISSGILSREEIISGELSQIEIPEDLDEATAAALAYETALNGFQPNPDEITEEVADMSTTQKQREVGRYRRSLQEQKSQTLQRIQGLRSETEAARTSALEEVGRQRNQLAMDAEKILSGMQENRQRITGTATVPDDQMRKVIAHAIKNPQYLHSMIFSPGKDGKINLAHAVSQIGKLAFGKKISQDLIGSSKNLGKEQVLEQHSGIPVNGQSVPVSAQSKAQKLDAGFKEFFNM